MPSVKWMEAEERIFNDPLYQDAHPQFVHWIEQLQRAKTADDLNDLQYELVPEFGARQVAVADFITSKREEVKAEHQRLLNSDPKPIAEMQEQQALLDRLELREDVNNALQHSTRVIADGIVWRALDYDRTAIAVLAEGQRVGRFADEDGLQPELRRMDDLRDRYGVLAIHNGLTNCIRVGDVTGIFVTENGQRLPVPVEVKKTQKLTANSPQVKRIFEAMHRIETGRLHLPLAYRTFMNDLPELIRRAKATGHATMRPAPCVFVEVCDFRHFGGRPGALGELSRKAHNKLGWLDSDQFIYTGQTAVSRARDRHETVSELAPISIFPLPAEDVADILFGFVDVKVLLNVPLLHIAFIRKGFYTEIHRAPESGHIFLTAQNDKSGIIVPAHLREQILHEMMTPSTLIRMVEHIIESGLAAKWKADGSAPGVGFADERRAWSRAAPIDVSSVNLVPAGFPAVSETASSGT